jgi:hypothetical protein
MSDSMRKLSAGGSPGRLPPSSYRAGSDRSGPVISDGTSYWPTIPSSVSVLPKLVAHAVPGFGCVAPFTPE